MTVIRLREGARVHHRGAIYSRDWDPDEGEGGWGWGTVLRSVPQHDGTYEYEIQRDEALASGLSNAPTWWASYHIDRVLEA